MKFLCNIKSTKKAKKFSAKSTNEMDRNEKVYTK